MCPIVSSEVEVVLYVKESYVAEGIGRNYQRTNRKESCAYLAISENTPTYTCDRHWIWIKVEYPQSEVD